VFELNVTIPSDHPQYEWSADIDALLPAIDMVVRVYLEDLFKCDELPPDPGDPASSFVNDPNCIGYYIGATELFDIADLLSGFLPLAHPLIPFIQVAGYPPFPEGPSATHLEFTEGVNGIGPFPTVASEGTGLIGAGINIDFGIVSDWMAEASWGAMMPANLYLDIQMVFMDATTDPPIPFTDPANDYGFIPYPSCTYQYDGRIGDLQDDAYPGRYTPNPATVVVVNQRPMFCDPPEKSPGVLNDACGGGINSGTGDEMINTNLDNYYEDSDGGGPIIFDTDIADRYATLGAGLAQMHFLQGDCNPTLGTGVIGAGVDDRDACAGDYMLGIGLHQDVISELVYGLIASGVLCLTIDPTEATGNTILDMFNGSDADSTLGSLLTLSTGNAILSFLLPTLPEKFGTDAPIIIKLVPYTMDPRTRSKTFKHIPRAWTGGQITEVIDNQYSPATNPTGLVYEPTQWVYGANNAAFSTYEFAEIDLQIDVPHMLIEFWTKECTDDPADIPNIDLVDRNYEAPQRVFSLDLGFRMGIDIDILSPMPSPMTFPTGANWTVTETARTLFLGMVIDPNVKMLFSYLENVNPTYPCVDSDHPICGNAVVGGYNDPTYGAGSVYTDADYHMGMLEDYMGNLLTTVLSLIAQFELRLTIDLGARGIGTALPPIPLAVNGSIEASCSQWEFDNFVCPRSTDQDAVGLEGDNYGDFLQIYLSLVGDLPIAFIYQFLLCALIPDDDSCEGFAFSLDSLGLSPAGAINRTDVLFETPNFNPPETAIMPIVNANPYEMVIDFQAYDNDSASESLLYSWRLDNSAWRPFLPLSYAVLRGLGDGVHTFEVRAIDEHKFLEPELAKV
jgi:hypothetical protein